MRQLDLLSWVIPAFGALGKDFIRDTNDQNLVRDAQDYYSDIVQLGQAVATSRGEWTSGLREEQVDRLLKTLESRLPKDTLLASFTGLPFVISAAYAESPEKHQQGRPFKKLHILADRIQDCHLGGYSACGELPNQTDRDENVYLKIIRQDSKVKLFHQKGRASKSEREKFLEPVKMAAKHMLNVYFKDFSTPDAPEMSLSQHPSSGMKEISNRIYGLLHQHWQCNCERGAKRLHEQREARLSLVRHHVLALKLSSSWTEAPRRRPEAKYEILLPMCEEQAMWKVTNVEVNNDAKRYVTVIIFITNPRQARPALHV